VERTASLPMMDLVPAGRGKVLRVFFRNPVHSYKLKTLEFSKAQGSPAFSSVYYPPLISIVLRLVFEESELPPEAHGELLQAYQKELALFGGSPPSDETLYKFLPVPPKDFPKGVSSFYRGSLFPSILKRREGGGYTLYLGEAYAEALSEDYVNLGKGFVLLSEDDLLEILVPGGFLAHKDIPAYLLVHPDSVPAFAPLLERSLRHVRPPDAILEGLVLPEGLWAHQREGVSFLYRLYHEGRGGGYLAFDMGTGKTLTSLSFARAIESKRTLVVCPKSVIPTWSREARSWFGDYFTTILPLDGDSGDAYSKANLLRQAVRSLPALVVVNYESLIRQELHEAAKSVEWDLLILDEAHWVKNHKSKRFKYLSELKRRFSIALSGTPMTQGPQDLWSQAYLLDPSYLGPNYYAYINTYTIKGGFKGKQIVGVKNQDRLAKKTSRFMMRVSIDDVLELPEQIFLEAPVYLSDEAMRLHDELWRSLWDYLKAEELNLPTAATAILRMQQLTGGYFVRGDTKLRVDRAKEEALSDLVESLGDEPVVVFAIFHDDLDVISEVAKRTGRAYGELSGRRNDLDSFQRGLVDLLAVQIRSGGIGVDLTRSRYAVYYSLGYNLGDYLQSLARIRRPGQTRKTVYYHLIAKGTIDEHVYRALSRKQDVVDSLVSMVRGSS